jgi:hypothetical protein
MVAAPNRAVAWQNARRVMFTALLLGPTFGMVAIPK